MRKRLPLVEKKWKRIYHAIAFLAIRFTSLREASVAARTVALNLLWPKPAASTAKPRAFCHRIGVNWILRQLMFSVTLKQHRVTPIGDFAGLT
jgi:hypothetical protein